MISNVDSNLDAKSRIFFYFESGCKSTNGDFERETGVQLVSESKSIVPDAGIWLTFGVVTLPSLNCLADKKTNCLSVNLLWDERLARQKLLFLLELGTDASCIFPYLVSPSSNCIKK